MAKLTIDIGAKIDKLVKGLKGSGKAVKDWGKRVKVDIDRSLKTPKPIKPKIDIRPAKRKIGELHTGWSKLKTVMTKPISFRAMATGMGAMAAAIGALVFKSVKLAAAFEQTRIAFNTMLGDSAKGGAMLDDLIEFSRKTPFTPEQTIKAGKTLLAFGFEAKEVTSTIRMLGDVSAGTGKDLSELAVIFGQIKGAGKLMGQDLLQLVSAGFSPLQAIAEKTGKTMGEVRKDMRNGAISFKMVEEVFKDATSEGGKFFNLMEKQSKSLSGRFSTLKGSVEQLGISMGNILLPVLKVAAEEMNELADSALALQEANKSTADDMTGIKLALVEWLEMINPTIRGADFLTKALGLTGEQAVNTAAQIEAATEAIRKMNAEQEKVKPPKKEPVNVVDAFPEMEQLLDIITGTGDFGEQLRADMAVVESEGRENLTNDLRKGDSAMATRRANDQREAAEFEDEMAKIAHQGEVAIAKDMLTGAETQAATLQKDIASAFQPGGKIQSRLARIGGDRTINVDRQIPQKQLDQLVILNKEIPLMRKDLQNLQAVFPG